MTRLMVWVSRFNTNVKGQRSILNGGRLHLDEVGISQLKKFLDSKGNPNLRIKIVVGL